MESYEELLEQAYQKIKPVKSTTDFQKLRA